MTRILCLVSAVVVASACKQPGSVKKNADLPFQPAGPNDAPDPSKMGPYPVGVVTYEGIIDATADSIGTPGPEVRHNPDGQPRHLVTEVWYPAVESARGLPGKAYNVVDLMTDQEQLQVQQANVQIPLLQTVAVENALPRLADGPFPIVVFSHGQYGIRWQTTFFTVMLASHGYIVVSPDHPGDTLQDELSLKSTSSGALGSSITANYFDRQADVEFLISYFTSLGTSDFLHGMVDPTQIGMSGHSFGALTSLRIANNDPRVKATVPMAPTNAFEALAVDGNWGPTLRIQTPTLIEGAGKDHTLPFACNAVDAYGYLGGPRALVDVVAGGHFSFSDLCKFKLDAAASAIQFIDVSNVIDDGCGPTNTPADVAEPIINNYAIGFFNWQLRGSTPSKKYLTLATGEALSPTVPNSQAACMTLGTECSVGQDCDPGIDKVVCPPSGTDPMAQPGTCQTVDFTSSL